MTDATGLQRLGFALAQAGLCVVPLAEWQRLKAIEARLEQLAAAQAEREARASETRFEPESLPTAEERDAPLCAVFTPEELARVLDKP